MTTNKSGWLVNPSSFSRSREFMWVILVNAREGFKQFVCK